MAENYLQPLYSYDTTNNFSPYLVEDNSGFFASFLLHIDGNTLCIFSFGVFVDWRLLPNYKLYFILLVDGMIGAQFGVLSLLPFNCAKAKDCS